MHKVAIILVILFGLSLVALFKFYTVLPRELEEFKKTEFSTDIVGKARQVGLEARQSVVLLKGGSDKPEERGGGTGWFIARGLIVTNGHNIEASGGKIIGQMPNGDTFETEVVNYRTIPDIGLLKTSYTKAPPLPLGSSRDLKGGQALVQVGHPAGFGEWAIMLGPYVKKGDEKKGFGLLSLIPTREGVSGSPVLTLDGKVVGMTSGGTTEASTSDRFIPQGPSTVYQSFPENELTTHDPIEVILQYVKEWTGKSLDK